MAIYINVKCKHEETVKSSGLTVCKNCRKVISVSKQEE